jgi:hypothetical protein
MSKPLTRILRAIEEKGDETVTEDFEVNFFEKRLIYNRRCMRNFSKSPVCGLAWSTKTTMSSSLTTMW